MVKLLSANMLSKLDHEDVKENAGSIESERRKYRLGIINQFMKWQAKNQPFIQNNQDEKVALAAVRYERRMLIAFATLTNFFVYQAFLTGTYNYRTTELLVMRRVPFVLKFSISTGVAGYMYYLLR